MAQVLKRTDLPLVVMLLLVSSSDASAYIDPGTGSYLFQLAIAGGLASLYAIRRYWSTLRASLVSRFRSRAEDAATPHNGMD